MYASVKKNYLWGGPLSCRSLFRYNFGLTTVFLVFLLPAIGGITRTEFLDVLNFSRNGLASLYNCDTSEY